MTSEPTPADSHYLRAKAAAADLDSAVGEIQGIVNAGIHNDEQEKLLIESVALGLSAAACGIVHGLLSISDVIAEVHPR